MTDRALLQRFAESRAEDAFAEIVRRYGSMVHATARRILRDAHLAEDATQAVFVVLAQKARELPADTVLPAWLYTAAWNAAQNLRRAEMRRTIGERRAAPMKQASAMPLADDSGAEQVQEHLDEALHELSEPLRQAIVLRCLLQHSYADCAQLAATSEKAFSMRLSRALETLRQKLERRGISISGLILSELIAKSAAPTANIAGALQQAILATALGKAAASPQVFLTAKGVIHVMFWSHLKIATVAAIALLLLGVGAATGYLAHPATPRTETPAVASVPVPTLAPAPAPAPASASASKPGAPAVDPGKNEDFEMRDALNAMNRAYDEISKTMGKRDLDWAVARPLDARLSPELRRHALIGMPGMLPPVIQHPGKTYWVSVLAIDLKDPAQSQWWEFSVSTDKIRLAVCTSIDKSPALPLEKTPDAKDADF